MSWAIARSGINRQTRLATTMILIAGLAADLDWLTYWAGPRAFMLGHRTFLHSVLGALAIAVLMASIFWVIGRTFFAGQVSIAAALMACGIGSMGHLVIDLANPWGLKLFWPISEKWMGWDLVNEVDPWLLAILASGLLLPILFRLIGEEIGARKKSSGTVGAILTLALAFGYLGGRAALHHNALTILRSRIYRGEVAKAVEALPQSANPFTWSGIVETEGAIHEIEVSTLGAPFDPDQAKTQYKPEPSPALEGAMRSSVAAEFLKFARFPKAAVEPTETGYRVRLSDLRFSASRASQRSPVAVIDLDKQARVIRETLQF